MSRTTLAEIEIVRNLVDVLLADEPAEEIEANLYSARVHLTRALNEAGRAEVAA